MNLAAFALILGGLGSPDQERLELYRTLEAMEITVSADRFIAVESWPKSEDQASATRQFGFLISANSRELRCMSTEGAVLKRDRCGPDRSRAASHSYSGW